MVILSAMAVFLQPLPQSHNGNGGPSQPPRGRFLRGPVIFTTGGALYSGIASGVSVINWDLVLQSRFRRRSTLTMNRYRILDMNRKLEQQFLEDKRLV